MSEEEKVKELLLTIYDLSKLMDTVEDFNVINHESCSERLFRAFEAKGLDINKFLDKDYLKPVKFEDSLWSKK